MRYFSLVAMMLGCSLTLALAGHTPPKVMLRVHVQTTGEGQSNLEAVPIPLPPEGEQILVRALPEASESQLLEVQQDATGGVRLKFNHAAQVSLSAVTAQNQGRILVVLIDGQVVYAPVIDAQISNGEIYLPHAIPAAQVLLLQEVAKENRRQAART